MIGAPAGGVYIAPAGGIEYWRELAKRAGRDDLRVESVRFYEAGLHRGLAGILTIDHAVGVR